MTHSLSVLFIIPNKAMEKIHHTTLCARSRNTHFLPQLEEKMASPKSKHTNKSYLCGHIVETISTEKYTIMCGGHVPVHLFPSATDVMFVRFHHGVSVTHLFFVHVHDSIGSSKHTVFSEILLNFQTEDTNHPSPKVISCTRCGEAFRNETSIGEIQSHNATCKIRVPKFVSICRLCGKVCTCAGRDDTRSNQFSPR